MDIKEIEYLAGNTLCKGYIAYTPSKEKKPVVLILSTWQGINSFTKSIAMRLVALGYVAFAVDMYGEGKSADNNEDAANLMAPLYLDRILLTNRVLAGYNIAKTLPEVDPQKIGAIGFCFGGLAVLELLRTGVFLNAAITFHATLGASMLGKKVQLAPRATQYNGSLLLLHGYKDPLVSQDEIIALQAEMDQQHLDFELVIFGKAAHGFTNPDVHDKNSGLYFEETANNRGFEIANAFLKEKLS